MVDVCWFFKSKGLQDIFLFKASFFVLALLLSSKKGSLIDLKIALKSSGKVLLGPVFFSCSLETNPNGCQSSCHFRTFCQAGFGSNFHSFSLYQSS